jgi:hypothetical protein
MLSLLGVALGCSIAAQLNDEQVERLARLNCELSNAWTISDLHEQDFLIGGRNTTCYSADLYTAKTSRKGNNEGVSLYFFEKAVSDSVEARFPPTAESTYEFIYTKSFIVVVSYFSSNGKLYDMYTREMLKELSNYFTNWHTSY